MDLKFIEDTLQEKNKDITKGIWKKLNRISTEYGMGWHDLIIEMLKKVEKIYKKII